jgi:hypothetical protein
VDLAVAVAVVFHLLQPQLEALELKDRDLGAEMVEIITYGHMVELVAAAEVLQNKEQIYHLIVQIIQEVKAETDLQLTLLG